MRDYKYKVWDKRNKKMYDVASMTFRTNNDVFRVLGKGLDPNKHESWFLIGESAELLEYTGEKDKNGKEIYDVDILVGKHSRQDGTHSYITTDYVKHRMGGFVLFGKNMQDFTVIDDKIKEIFWCDRGHLNTPDMYYKIEGVEVIGNIYENPKLLEERA